VDLNARGIIVLAALISPYRAARDQARAAIGDRFIEIHVHAPLGVVIARDVKGLYRRALAGELAEFTGISAPYEPPLHPDITVDTSTALPAESAAQILAALPLTAHAA
jgi:adenylylsulfate kinase-like enzyme